MAVLRPTVFELNENFAVIELPFYYLIPELNDPYPNKEGGGNRSFTVKRTFEHYDSKSRVKRSVSVEMRFRWTIEKKLEVLSLVVGEVSKEEPLPLEEFRKVEILVSDTKSTIEGARRASELLAIPQEELLTDTSRGKLAEIGLSFGLLAGYWDQKSKVFASVCLELVEWLRENDYPSPTKKAIELLSEVSGKPIAPRTFERRLDEARKARQRDLIKNKKLHTSQKSAATKDQKPAKKGTTK